MHYRSEDARAIQAERRTADRERTVVRHVERSRKAQFGGTW